MTHHSHSYLNVIIFSLITKIIFVLQGPCGDQTDDFSGPVTELAPGWNTLVIEETIVHSGKLHIIGPVRVLWKSELNFEPQDLRSELR